MRLRTDSKPIFAEGFQKRGAKNEKLKVGKIGEIKLKLAIMQQVQNTKNRSTKRDGEI